MGKVSETDAHTIAMPNSRRLSAYPGSAQKWYGRASSLLCLAPPWLDQRHHVSDCPVQRNILGSLISKLRSNHVAVQRARVLGLGQVRFDVLRIPSALPCIPENKDEDGGEGGGCKD